MDDTCTAVHVDRVKELLDHLNSIEESIQFTVEVKQDGKLPFLDVLLTHDPHGTISTSVYRKPTHTDKYLDFDSHHLLSHKKSVVCNLLTRASTHSSLTSNVLGEVSGLGRGVLIVPKHPLLLKHTCCFLMFLQ